MGRMCISQYSLVVSNLTLIDRLKQVVRDVAHITSLVVVELSHELVLRVRPLPDASHWSAGLSNGRPWRIGWPSHIMLVRSIPLVHILVTNEVRRILRVHATTVGTQWSLVLPHVTIDHILWVWNSVVPVRVNVLVVLHGLNVAWMLASSVDMLKLPVLGSWPQSIEHGHLLPDLVLREDRCL